VARTTRAEERNRQEAILLALEVRSEDRESAPAETPELVAEEIIALLE
jgi:hypothetical protein